MPVRGGCRATGAPRARRTRDLWSSRPPRSTPSPASPISGCLGRGRSRSGGRSRSPRPAHRARPRTIGTDRRHHGRIAGGGLLPLRRNGAVRWSARPLMLATCSPLARHLHHRSATVVGVVVVATRPARGPTSDAVDEPCLGASRRNRQVAVAPATCLPGVTEALAQPSEEAGGHVPSQNGS